LNTEHRTRFQGKIDVIAAIAGALLGVVISCLNLIYSNAYMITIGPMLIIVCLVYLVFRRKLLAPISDLQASRSPILINIIFWLSFAGSIYSLSTEILHRPVTYFILTSLCASMIALQILYAQGRATIYLIVFEILLISLSVRASAFFVFPTIPGSDPWAHLVYIKDFVNLGHIESTRGWIYYLNYPIVHLNAVTMKLITGVDYKTTMFLGIGLPVMLSTIFVFLIGRSVVNVKIGLLAALLLNLADYHLRYSVSLGSTGFGLALFTIIVYLLVRDRGALRVSTTGLVILLLLIMVITHTMSTLVMFCFLVFFLVGMYVYRFLYKERGISRASIVTPTLVIMFGVAMLAYWMYAGYTEGLTFFESVIRGFYSALTEEAGFLARPAPLSAEYGWLDPILNITGFLLLYLCGTLGCLLWFSRQNQSRTRVALITAVVLLTAFALSFPVFGIRNIAPYRWFAFIYVILSVVAAFAIFTVIPRINYRRLGSVILVGIIFGISFFMTTNSTSNLDSPIYAAELSQRMVYTSSEMAVATKVVEVYDGKIITDLQYGGRVLGTYLGRGDVSSNMLSKETLNSGLVIWRDVMAERPVQASHESVVLGEAFEQRLENSHNLVYSNNTSKAFLARGM